MRMTQAHMSLHSCQLEIQPLNSFVQLGLNTCQTDSCEFISLVVLCSDYIRGEECVYCDYWVCGVCIYMRA